MPGPRFLTLTDVAEVLNVSLAQVKALVRSGDLRGVKIGGRGVWRVEDVELEAYIARMYTQTRESLRAKGKTMLHVATMFNVATGRSYNEACTSKKIKV